jgi:hypothetical protein
MELSGSIDGSTVDCFDSDVADDDLEKRLYPVGEQTVGASKGVRSSSDNVEKRTFAMF